MKLALAFIFTALAGLPLPARAQGAIVEELPDVKTDAPPAFRGLIQTSVDLSPEMPLPRAQADTSTCVSWAVTYAAASLALRPRFPGLTLSPAFTYNQVARDPTCQSGTAASKTLNMLRDVGALPVDEFAFDAGSCDRIPSAAELQSAARYKIKSWSSFDARNLDMMKQQLARGAAVMFSMRTGPKMRALRGDDVLDTDTPNGGGHQLVVVGYDDAKQAFKIQNSWGKGWGNGGYGWFSYDFWKQTIRVAYVID